MHSLLYTTTDYVGKEKFEGSEVKAEPTLFCFSDYSA